MLGKHVTSPVSSDLEFREYHSIMITCDTAVVKLLSIHLSHISSLVLCNYINFCWQARDTECCCLCLVVVFVSKLSLSISCFNSGNLTALNWQLNVCLFWFTVISWHFEIGQGMVRSACNMLWVFVTTCRMISISIHLNSVAGLFSRNYLSLLPTAGHILDIYRRNGCLLSTFWSHIIDRMY